MKTIIPRQFGYFGLLLMICGAPSAGKAMAPPQAGAINRSELVLANVLQGYRGPSPAQDGLLMAEEALSEAAGQDEAEWPVGLDGGGDAEVACAAAPHATLTIGPFIVIG